MNQLENIHINDINPIISPDDLKSKVAISDQLSTFVIESRQAIQNILHHKDDRKLVIVGPCSIHDTKAALDYAEKLAPLVKKYSDKLFIVMRTYFEKPRTNIGWKGLINDPNLDNSYKIEYGLCKLEKLC